MRYCYFYQPYGRYDGHRIKAQIRYLNLNTAMQHLQWYTTNVPDQSETPIYWVIIR